MSWGLRLTLYPSVGDTRRASISKYSDTSEQLRRVSLDSSLDAVFVLFSLPTRHPGRGQSPASIPTSARSGTGAETWHSATLTLSDTL